LFLLENGFLWYRIILLQLPLRYYYFEFTVNFKRIQQQHNVAIYGVCLPSEGEGEGEGAEKKKRT
jgi:hypothetical protein